MSNLAEKLPRFVKEKLEDVQARRQELVGRIDSWADTNLPQSVVEPIRSTESLSVDGIRDAATAAGDELVSYLRGKWTLLRGGKADETNAPTPATETPVVQKPAAKTPAARKPAAKKPAARKPAAKKPAARKPAAKKPAARKPVAKKPVAKKPAAKKPVAKKPAAKKPVAKKPVAKKPTTPKAKAE
jgi:outer membrane biosynthesis protein TonB